MTSTIVGQVVTRDGMARQSYLHQPAPERIGVSIAYRLPPPKLRSRLQVERCGYPPRAAGLRPDRP